MFSLHVANYFRNMDGIEEVLMPIAIIIFYNLNPNKSECSECESK